MKRSKKMLRCRRAAQRAHDHLLRAQRFVREAMSLAASLKLKTGKRGSSILIQLRAMEALERLTNEAAATVVLSQKVGHKPKRKAKDVRVAVYPTDADQIEAEVGVRVRQGDRGVVLYRAAEKDGGLFFVRLDHMDPSDKDGIGFRKSEIKVDGGVS